MAKLRPKRYPEKRRDNTTHQHLKETLDANRQGLTRFLYRRTKDFHIAEDLCQEAMFRAYKAISTLESPARLKSWLYSIAYHVTVDWLRNQSIQKRICTGLNRWPADNYWAPGIDEVLIVQEEKKRHQEKVDLIWRAVKSLPPIYRDVFELRYKNWSPIAEISRKIGISEGNIKVRLFRARRLLIKTLGNNGL